MAGAGDIVATSREQATGCRRRRRQTAAWLPLDVVAGIAARSDAATLVRCAATCRDARRRIADDPGSLGRLRLRHTDRFLLPLLRGHLMRIYNYKERAGTHLYMVDTTAADADATRVTKVTFGPQGKTSKGLEPMDSRRGVLIVHAPAAAGSSGNKVLRVCNPATGRSQTLPPEPPFPQHGARETQYVVLVGDGGGDSAVGRPFKVLKATLFLRGDCRSNRRLLFQTFSSEHGAWGPRTRIPTPNLHGNNFWTPLGSRPLVVGDVVHWLCLTDAGSYVLILHAGAERVNETALPASFPRGETHQYHYLLAETLEGPAVLVADDQRISAWVQSKHTKKWKQQPQVVMENKEVLGLLEENVAELVARCPWTKVQVKLVWFAESSGAVLIRVPSCGLLLLDLQSKKIIRRLSDPRVADATAYCPIEMDFTSWIPTFDSTCSF
ncbi:unnamed protein product [Urochloa decumbens]|uniref:DUF7595 domain-containing protein n=1 Tax=Urochloa decumbens TaxID=240449 RepID=A0ABC9FZ03_9POAL